VKRERGEGGKGGGKKKKTACLLGGSIFAAASDPWEEGKGKKKKKKRGNCYSLTAADNGLAPQIEKKGASFTFKILLRPSQ